MARANLPENPCIHRPYGRSSVPDIAANVSASLQSLVREFDIITHNIANASTTGYKRQCSSFADALGSQMNPTGQTDGNAESTERVFDFSQGSLTQTGRSLDLALAGKGFFVVETPEGPLYTRNGMFQTNQNGQVVDSEGRLIAGEGGPLVIPSSVDSSKIGVGTDGTVHAGSTTLGRLRIVDFTDAEDQLLPAGRDCWRAPADAPAVDAEGVTVKQGYREASNVTLVEELVNMITVTRAYEANVKLVSVSRQAVNSLLGVAMG